MEKNSRWRGGTLVVLTPSTLPQYVHRWRCSNRFKHLIHTGSGMNQVSWSCFRDISYWCGYLPICFRFLFLSAYFRWNVTKKDELHRVLFLGALVGIRCPSTGTNIHIWKLWKKILYSPSKSNLLPIKITFRASWMGNIWKLWRSLGKLFWGNDTIHTCAATYPHLTWASMGYWLYYFSILSPQGIP